MPDPSLPELFQQVNNLSASYAQSTTRLSDLVQEFEAVLDGLEGKVEVGVGTPQGDIYFRRLRDKWGLVWNPGPGKGLQPLTSAPVTVKTAAALSFSKLLECIAEHHRTRRNEVQAAINTVETLLGRAGKEG